MPKYAVATVAEIPAGQRKIVEVAGRSIGLFNLNGEFFALRNSCPHQGGPLCLGRVTGFLEARVPGERTYSRHGEILRCSWHAWEFDIRTGQSWHSPDRVWVRQYDVSVGEDPVEGPYQAETFPVAVDDRDVIFIEVPSSPAAKSGPGV